MQALLEDPHILVIFEQKHIHYAAQEFLNNVHTLGVKVCHTLDKVS